MKLEMLDSSPSEPDRMRPARCSDRTRIRTPVCVGGCTDMQGAAAAAHEEGAVETQLPTEKLKHELLVEGGDGMLNTAGGRASMCAAADVDSVHDATGADPTPVSVDDQGDMGAVTRVDDTDMSNTCVCSCPNLDPTSICSTVVVCMMPLTPSLPGVDAEGEASSDAQLLPDPLVE
jgi:hypothetical protein